MTPGQPSHTAHRAALVRARHQLIDTPRVFDDPLALRIIGADAARQLQATGGRGRDSVLARGFRAALVSRARLAEDALQEARRTGVKQYVVLGAGLDTYACRQAVEAAGLTVFEVDHPATQAWKRQRLHEAGIEPPPHLRWVAVDFEQQSLRPALREAGFREDAPAFFAWLGVTMYLEPATTLQTLRTLAGMTPAGGGIVFDVVEAPPAGSWLRRLLILGLKRRFARMGEPWRGFFELGALQSQLSAMGFTDVRCHDAHALNARYFAAHPRLRLRPLAAVVEARLPRRAAD